MTTEQPALTTADTEAARSILRVLSEQGITAHLKADGRLKLSQDISGPLYDAVAANAEAIKALLREQAELERRLTNGADLLWQMETNGGNDPRYPKALQLFLGLLTHYEEMAA